jgi:hypothetical protein
MRCRSEGGEMSHILRFEHSLGYDAGKEGITVPVTLRLGQNWIHVETKFDTGSSYCIFERLHGEMLGLDIETGFPQWIGTPTGSFLTYGHGVTLSVKDYDFDVVAYFAKDEWFNRNVLGRYGWLNRIRMGLIDYEGKLYLSRADDES